MLQPVLAVFIEHRRLAIDAATKFEREKEEKDTHCSDVPKVFTELNTVSSIYLIFLHVPERFSGILA